LDRVPTAASPRAHPHLHSLPPLLLQVDIGGYFMLDDAKANAAMRPSKAFNALIGANN
jgi:hypothetical protein